jgi:hypothetical protein
VRILLSWAMQAQRSGALFSSRTRCSHSRTEIVTYPQLPSCASLCGAHVHPANMSIVLEAFGNVRRCVSVAYSVNTSCIFRLNGTWRIECHDCKISRKSPRESVGPHPEGDSERNIEPEKTLPCPRPRPRIVILKTIPSTLSRTGLRCRQSTATMRTPSLMHC